jgi:hypothetical protein
VGSSSVGPAQDLDPASSGAGLVDLRSAVQQEVSVVPATVSFGSVESAPEFERFTLEQTVRLRNVSTRTLVVRIASAALAPKGVVIESTRSRPPACRRGRRGSCARRHARARSRRASPPASLRCGSPTRRKCAFLGGGGPERDVT